MKSVKFKITSRISENLPKIILEFSYQDEFSDDNYRLISHSNPQKGATEIPFSISKNQEEFTEILLSNKDMESFIESFVKECDDNEFKKELEKNNAKQSITNEFNDFMKRYDDMVVSTGITTEGEVLRMRKLAGLLK